MNRSQLGRIYKETGGKLLVLSLDREPNMAELTLGGLVAVGGRVVKNRLGPKGGTLAEAVQELRKTGQRYTVISIV